MKTTKFGAWLTCGVVLFACGDDGGSATTDPWQPTEGALPSGSPTDGNESDTDTPPGGTAGDDDDDATDDGLDSSDDGSEPPPTGVLAGDIAIDTVEVNQGVGIEIARTGEILPTNSRVAPVIGGRPALVRASYQLAPSFTPRQIVGRLWLVNGPEAHDVYTEQRMVSGGPDWGDIDGTFHWFVAPEDLTADTEFRVQFLEVDEMGEPSGDTSGSELPAGAFAPLDAWGDRMVLEVMLVPMSCSGWPELDLSAQNIADFEAFLFNTYPVQELELTVHEPVFSNSCDAFYAAEDELPALRQSEGADPWVYYGGILPGNGGGYSIAIQGSDQMDYRRTFANHTWRDYGLTFDLFAHELGHNHGRDHTFEDGSYPGNNGGSCGSISTYGWGPRSGLMPSSSFSNDKDIGISWFDPHDTLLWPTDSSCGGLPEGNRWNFNDMMSYQYPYWVSAYTYAAAADRVRLISSWSNGNAPEGEPGHTRRLVLGPEGDVHRFDHPGVITVEEPETWAICDGPEGELRVPVRHGSALRELRGDEGELRSFTYETYELPVPAGFDPSSCRLEGQSTLFVAD